jgi:hypothetical protein
MTNIASLDGSTELIVAQCMARDLEAYLKSDIVYWNVAEPNPLGSRMPELTIGALLEALVRAEAGGAAAAEVAAARAQHDRIRAAHAALYTRKALHELHSRLGAWQKTLESADRKTDFYYVQDIHLRAKVYLLEQALGAAVPIELQQQRERLDQDLFEIFIPGEFIWDSRLSAAFPQKPCWWLYGHLLDIRRR